MQIPMFNKFALLLVFVQLLVSIAQKEIYDPRGIFCGKVSCYDVLNITRKSPPREIKRAYRRLSLEHHPDKNKADNATKIFKRIAKAYEVLNGNESRPLFDYYLDHPRDYFKVSGHHYFRNLPKSDVRLVILLVACLLSGFFYFMQKQRYEAAIKKIKNAMANTSRGTKGSSKQIVDLQDKAAALYEEHIQSGNTSIYFISHQYESQTLLPSSTTLVFFCPALQAFLYIKCCGLLLIHSILLNQNIAHDEFMRF